MKRVLFFWAVILYSLNTLAQNPLPNIYGGGSNDGFQMAVAGSQNALPNIYGGGFGNAQLTVNGLDFGRVWKAMHPREVPTPAAEPVK